MKLLREELEIDYDNLVEHCRTTKEFNIKLQNKEDKELRNFKKEIGETDKKNILEFLEQSEEEFKEWLTDDKFVKMDIYSIAMKVFEIQKKMIEEEYK